MKHKISHVYIKGDISRDCEWVLNIQEGRQDKQLRVATIANLLQLLEVLWVLQLVESIELEVQVTPFDLSREGRQERFCPSHSFITGAAELLSHRANRVDCDGQVEVRARFFFTIAVVHVATVLDQYHVSCLSLKLIDEFTLSDIIIGIRKK